jgi:hypothetical protein
MTQPLIDPALAKSFAEVLQLIQAAKQKAFQTVNTQLVELHWQVGAYISQKLAQAEWVMGLCRSWPLTWRKPSQDCVDLHHETYFGCVNFTRPTAMMKK